MSWVRGAPFSFMLFKKQTEKRRRGDRYQYRRGSNPRGSSREPGCAAALALLTATCRAPPTSTETRGAPGSPSAQFRPNWPLNPGLWLLNVSNQGWTFWVQVEARGGMEMKYHPISPQADDWCSSTRLLYREAVNLFTTSPLGCKMPPKPWVSTCSHLRISS